MIEHSAVQMAEMVRRRDISVSELIDAHLQRIEQINPELNAVVHSLAESAKEAARGSDLQLADGEPCGAFFGVPFSIKDSIDVAGTPCTAGTLGRQNAEIAATDATLVRRLRAAGAIPVAKTNLPDLLFSFESDNLIFGRTNNPYDLERTPGGSSGGESALISACGSPMGLGSDCAGSVRLPAAFCGIASIKPTSGRLPRTGHVPPASGWVERLWQIGPMARHVDDLIAMMRVLCGEDEVDFTSPPVPLGEAKQDLRVAVFTHNGIAACDPSIRSAVIAAAEALHRRGFHVEERTPPCIDQTYELEMGILGADGAKGIDRYLREIRSTETHPLLTAFVDRMRPFEASADEFASRWAQWDSFRSGLMRFFERWDVVLSPVYVSPALPHGESVRKFEGFSYTMTWNVAGFPAATVRVAEADGLPINVQVIAKPWRDMTALSVCKVLEDEFGGWRKPAI